MEQTPKVKVIKVELTDENFIEYDPDANSLPVSVYLLKHSHEPSTPCTKCGNKQTWMRKEELNYCIPENEFRNIVTFFCPKCHYSRKETHWINREEE